MQNTIAQSANTIPYSVTALVHQLLILLGAKGIVTAEEVTQLFKDAADSQQSTDVASFLADMHAEIQRNLEI